MLQICRWLGDPLVNTTCYSKYQRSNILNIFGPVEHEPFPLQYLSNYMPVLWIVCEYQRWNKLLTWLLNIRQASFARAASLLPVYQKVNLSTSQLIPWMLGRSPANKKTSKTSAPLDDIVDLLLHKLYHKKCLAMISRSSPTKIKMVESGISGQKRTLPTLANCSWLSMFCLTCVCTIFAHQRKQFREQNHPSIGVWFTPSKQLPFGSSKHHQTYWGSCFFLSLPCDKKIDGLPDKWG